MIVDISDHLPPVKVEPNAPVKVEPSWESTNKELEFTGADGLELNAPVDRYLLWEQVIYCHVIIFLGVNYYLFDTKKCTIYLFYFEWK